MSLFRFLFALLVTDLVGTDEPLLQGSQFVCLCAGPLFDEKSLAFLLSLVACQSKEEKAPMRLL